MSSTNHPSRGISDRYGVAFVLSGGAARGAIQVGMLQVLLERGIVPDLVVGTSVGSFNGAWLARHPTAEGMRGLEHVWSRVRFDHIFPGGPVGVLLHLLRHRPSLYTDDGIRSFVQRVSIEGGFFDCTFEDLPLPLAVVATNLTRGRPEIFREGPLSPALLASAAIPAMLPPVTINGEQFVDGGLLDNVGLRVAIEHGAERIYVLDTSWDGLATQPVTTFESVIDRSLEVVMAFHLQSALEFFAPRADVVLLRCEDAVVANANDFRATAELISAGRTVAERVLAAPERESARAIQHRRAAGFPARFPARPWASWLQGDRLRQALAQANFFRLGGLFGRTSTQAAAGGAPPRALHATQPLESASQQVAS
jgi:NTE family protein